MLDRGQKLIAAIIGLGTIGGSVAGAAIWAGGRASAAEVQTVREDVRVLKAEHVVEHEYDMRWKDWMAKSVQKIGDRLNAPVTAPPMVPVPSK